MKKIDDTYTIFISGKVINTKTNKELTHSLSSNGYLIVSLYRKAKKLHRLLAKAFIQNPNSYPVINHIDGNKLNNELDNLEWCTYSHNLQHAYDNKLRVTTLGKCSGVKHGRSNFTKDDILNIRDSKLSQKEIAIKYNCHPSIIQRIVTNKSYYPI